MVVWCALLFVLGILAFLDSFFNYGEIFRSLNSVLFMLISLGLMVRMATKARSKKLEKYEQRVFSLEQELATMKESSRKLQEY